MSEQVNGLIRIIREETIETASCPWRGHRSKLFSYSVRARIVRWLGQIFFLAVVVIGILVPDIGIRGGIAALAVLVAADAAIKWDARRKQLRQFGRQYVNFLEMSAEYVEFGIRQVRSTRVYWRFCRLLYLKRQQMFYIHIDQALVPIRPQSFSEQEISQIRYWAGRAKDEPDRCSKCKYDLRASAGPVCPECGAAIRVKDNATAGTSDWHEKRDDSIIPGD